MREIKTIKQAIPYLQRMYKAHCNKWTESKMFKGLIYWTHGKSENDPEFPVIYSTFKVIDKANKKLFGTGLNKIK